MKRAEQKGAKKIPQDLLQVHHQDNHCNGRLAGGRLTCHHTIEAIASLRLSEFTLDRIAFTRIQTLLSLLFVVQGAVLGRSSQLGAIQLDAAIGAIAQVIPCPVDLIPQDALRIITMAFPVAFTAVLQGL